MNKKPITTPDEMLEHLRDHISKLMDDEKEYIIDILPDSTEFQRIRSVGYMNAFRGLLDYMRNLEKHGYEHLTVKSYEDEI